MSDMLLIDPDAPHREWVRSFEWHLDIVPPLIDALVEATLPRIAVSRGGSRFDKDQITGGGHIDNMQILDHFDVIGDGHLVAGGAAADARDLWAWLTGYTAGVDAWIDAHRPKPDLAVKVNSDPLTARGSALLIVGWLIDHADEISTVAELEAHREEMFALIRRLRGQYGVFNHPRRARPALCHVCGERRVVVDWVDAGTGSPKPVRAGKCRNCGQVYRTEEES